MKLLVLFLVPVLVAGKYTTETWDTDDSHTLNNGPSMPSHKGPVKISLSYDSLETTTTEDPILKMILKKLIEDEINNEIEQEKRKDGGVKTPLVYMTPPPQKVESPTTSQPYLFEDDGITSTTDPTSSEEVTTIDPTDDSREEPTTLKSSKNKQSITTSAPQIKQYADNYLDYLPQVFTKKPNNSQVMSNEEKEERGSESNESEENEKKHMDKVVYDNPRPMTDQLQDVTPNQPDIETPPPTNKPYSMNSYPEDQQRPIYYFFLKPRPRAPIDSGMWYGNEQPQSNYPTELNTYPQRRIIRMPFIAQDYNENQLLASPSGQSYNYPSTYAMSNNFYNNPNPSPYQSYPGSSSNMMMMTYQQSPQHSYYQTPYHNEGVQPNNAFSYGGGDYYSAQNSNPFMYKRQYFNYGNPPMSYNPNPYHSQYPMSQDYNNNQGSPMRYNNFAMTQRYYI